MYKKPNKTKAKKTLCKQNQTERILGGQIHYFLNLKY